MDRLTESEEVLNKINAQVRGLRGKDMDSLRKVTKAMQDSIKEIREYISGTSSDRQGLSRPLGQVTVMGSMQSAQQYITSKSIAPGMQEETLVKNAEAHIDAAVDRINNFYSTKWIEYRRLVEGTRVNLFKDYEPIK